MKMKIMTFIKWSNKWDAFKKNGYVCIGGEYACKLSF